MDDVSELRREAADTPLHGVWAKGGPVFSHLSDATVHGLEGRSIASFGDAATLGFWAFATGIWITGLFQSGVLPQTEMQLLFPLLLVFSGLVLFIAGLFLYRRNNTFLASTFCSFSAFNLSRGVLFLAQAEGLLPQDATADFLQGCLIESFAYVAFSLFLGSLRMNVVAMLATGCTAVGFALSGLPFLTGALGDSASGWAQAGGIGGYFLLAAGFFAYYGGTALLVNTAWQRVVLPIGGQA